MTWCRQFFTPRYAENFLERVAESEVEFLVKLLGLGPGSRVFDQCCGTGRLSQALGLRGLQVVGVDLCRDYIARAQERSGPQGGEFFCADARTFIAQPCCDGGLNFHSSFGYFDSDEENLMMLQSAAASLGAGAPFLLDAANMARVIAHFQPAWETSPAPGLQVVRHSHIDWAKGLVCQRWVYRDSAGVEEETHSRLRLYLPHQLAQMLDAAGFHPEHLFGDFQGSAFQSDSPRALWLARRKRSR